MNASDILFRCSPLGHMMKNPREKSKRENGELADTVKTHLIDLFISSYYGRREEIISKYLEKGNAREEDSIDLLVKNDLTMYRKNGKRLKNEFITGEPDLFIGESIENAESTIDIKTSWSLHTFLRAKHDELNDMYYWQGQGYMALTSAKQHTVAYCLVNGTADAINNEKRKISYLPGMLDFSGNESEEYKERCRQIEINHIVDMESFKNENPGFDFHFKGDWTYDIPFNERIFKKTFERNDDEINAIYERIKLCRNWMDENLFSASIPMPA